jgi:hypothetical protein
VQEDYDGVGTVERKGKEKKVKVVLKNNVFMVMMERDGGRLEVSRPVVASHFEYLENGCLIALNEKEEVTGFFSPSWQYVVEHDAVCCGEART